jgi:predicted ArsR family transcriptional regulator
MDDVLPAGATLSERVRVLASIQERAGYLADSHAEDGGSLRLVERNCAIHHVAAGQPAACAAELALFREVLDADVVRERHIASGDRCCSYKISARPD